MPFQISFLVFLISAVTIGQELVDGDLNLIVRRVIGIFKHEFLEFRELTFNPIEP